MPDGSTFRPNWSWTAEMNLNPSARNAMAQVLNMHLKHRKRLRSRVATAHRWWAAALRVGQHHDRRRAAPGFLSIL
jgi:hypothetical protein